MNQLVNKRIKKYFFTRSIIFHLFIIILFASFVFINLFESFGLFVMCYIAFFGILFLLMGAFEKSKDISNLYSHNSVILSIAVLIIAIIKSTFPGESKYIALELPIYILLVFIDFIIEIKKISKI